MDAPIAKAPGATVRRMVSPEGKPSRTRYRVLREQGDGALVLLELETGRTHQIRIQFASRRMPLYGDSRYGSRYKAANPSLWACGLSLPDPLKHESTLFFRADPPDTDPWTRFIPD